MSDSLAEMVGRSYGNKKGWSTGKIGGREGGRGGKKGRVGVIPTGQRDWGEGGLYLRMGGRGHQGNGGLAGREIGKEEKSNIRKSDKC